MRILHIATQAPGHTSGGEMSKPVKAAFWFTVCSFLQRGISMIATPIFTRLLSTENYGLYSTYLSWELNVSRFVLTIIPARR